MKTKKILFVLHFPPPVHGAAMMGKYIMASNVLNDNFECCYINLGTSVEVNEIGNWGWIKLKRYFKILGLTIKRLYHDKPHLVYFTLTATGVGFYKDVAVALLAKLFGRKIVLHFHNKGISKRPNKWLDNALYKMVFKKAEVILSSRYLYYDIEEYVPIERVHYCPYGIPEKVETITKAKVVDNKVQILFLSNLIKSKGVYVLLEACKLLQDKQLSFHCTFIGSEADISEEDFQKKVSSLDVDEYVHYAGRKYDLEKVEAYSQSDIFVFPTYYSNECFPVVLIEAMQFSLPVISTFEGGIRDEVEDGKTGFLVRQKDVEALAVKLEILIKNPQLREQMGKNGRNRYEKHFTQEVFETRFTKIMKELV